MATHSNALAWEIPWTEKPGGLQSTGSQRVRHNWVTEHVHMHIQHPVLMWSKSILIQGETDKQFALETILKGNFQLFWEMTFPYKQLKSPSLPFWSSFIDRVPISILKQTEGFLFWLFILFVLLQIRFISIPNPKSMFLVFIDFPL